MSEKNRSLLRAVLLCVVLVILAFPVPASADASPKPSVRIRFENMGEAQMDFFYKDLILRIYENKQYFIVRTFSFWLVFLEVPVYRIDRNS